MLIDSHGRHGTALTLGVQTNAGMFEQDMHKKAKAWAPSVARSYRIEWFHHTDYHGRRCYEETGYGTFAVSYFTTKAEGDHEI